MSKLESLIEAIEAESIQPHPSHANLARLLALALREIQLPTISLTQEPQTTTSGNVTVLLQEVAEETLPKAEKKTHKKSAKK